MIYASLAFGNQTVYKKQWVEVIMRHGIEV